MNMKKTKKAQLKATSPIHAQNIRLYKHQNSSAESRDQNQKKQSRQKIYKQPSSAHLKTLKNEDSAKNRKAQQQNILKMIYVNKNKQSSIEKGKQFENTITKNPSTIFHKNTQSNSDTLKQHVPQIQLSLVDSFDKQIDYKQRFYAVVQSMKQKNIKQKSKNTKDKFLLTEANEHLKTYADQNQDISAKYQKKIKKICKLLKCQNNCEKQAKYIVEIESDEDILCCKECGNQYAKNGYDLEEIETLKSKRTYQMDQILQKSLKCLENLKKSKQYLPEYYKAIFNEIKLEIDTHQNYYQSLIDVIKKKKQQTGKILIEAINKISDSFEQINMEIDRQYIDVEQNYNWILIQKEKLKKMEQPAYRKTIKGCLQKLDFDERLFNMKLDMWKVEAGDIKQFQSEFQKYVVKIESDDQKTKNILQESTCQLFCEEEFDWGYKPQKQSIINKDIYFSFEKKHSGLENSGTYQNQFLHSPAFKQI